MFDLAVTHVWELWLSHFSLPQALEQKQMEPFSELDAVFYCHKQQALEFISKALESWSQQESHNQAQPRSGSERDRSSHLGMFWRGSSYWNLQR